jgi:hypothetical protein
MGVSKGILLNMAERANASFAHDLRPEILHVLNTIYIYLTLAHLPATRVKELEFSMDTNSIK